MPMPYPGIPRAPHHHSRLRKVMFQVSTDVTMSRLVAADPLPIDDPDHFAKEQLKNPEVLGMTRYLDSGVLL